jgi:PAS domain S-box-containing protein
MIRGDDHARRSRPPKSGAKRRKNAAVIQKVPKNKEWLRLATQAAHMGLWYWDEVSKGLFWDTKTREMFGVHADDDEATLETFYKALHPNDHDRVRDNWRYTLEHGLPYQLEYRSLWPDGTIRWIHARGSGYYDKAGKPLGMVGVVFDVTERKEAEQKHFELSGRLINAQEKERRRLARELHDDFSQRIALLANDLKIVAEMILDSPATASKRVHELGNEVNEIGADLHSLSHRLHSTKLELLGLVASIDSYCREVGKRQGLQIDVVHEEVPKLMPTEAALCLFRIVQEALRNVTKHSRASAVEVRLKGSLDSICLTLRDNGIGFDLSTKYTSNGIGVQSMNERARMLGGAFQLESAPMQGTKITVKIPLGSTTHSVS